jgi:rare lipoprotein A
MKHFIRGVIIISILLLLAMIMTACAPNRPILKGDRGYENSRDEGYNRGERDNDRPGDVRSGRNDRDMDKRYSETPRDKNQDQRDDRVDFDNVNDDSGDMDTPRREKYYQTGKASWYGREFQGRKTASGEKFDMNELTAAHRTLPFGSLLEVKNLDTGRTVRVRVNDRGPFKRDRILDLSYAAAKGIGIVRSGEAMIGITLLEKGKNARNDRRRSDDDIEGVSGDDIEKMDDDHVEKRGGRDDSLDERDQGGFALQAGAFLSKNNAMKLRRKLQDQFNRPVVVIKDGDLYKVRVEGVRSKSEARKFKRMLDEEKIKSFILKEKE